MNSIADALVYAVAYINLRANEDEDDDGYDEDDDVGALESIAGYFNSATEEEKDALALAAKRALQDELNGTARGEFIKSYSNWMEEMFGEGWTGNERDK